MARNRVLAGLHRASGRTRRPPGAMVAPGGRQRLEGLLRSPIHSNVSPCRQDDVLKLSTGQANKKPQQVATEVSTRRGFRSELYRNSSGRQTGMEDDLRAIFTSLLAVGNLGVMSPDHPPDSRQLLPPCRDRTRPGSTPRSKDPGASWTYPSFTFISWARYPDEGVGLPAARSLSSRCPVLLVTSIAGSSIPA